MCIDVTGTQFKASDVGKQWASVGVNCRLISEPKNPRALLLSQSTTSSPATQTNTIGSQGSEYLPTHSEENEYDEERFVLCCTKTKRHIFWFAASIL